MACASCGFGDTPTGQGCALEYEEMGAIQLKATSAPRLEDPIRCDETTCIPKDLKALAMSYTIDGKRESFLRPTMEIFDYSYNDVIKAPINDFVHTTVEGDSVKDWANRLSANLQVNGSYYAFSAAVSTSFTNEGATKVRTYRRDHSFQFQTYQVSSQALLPHKKLREDVKDFLMTQDPEQIHKTLGDYYATEVTFGGSLTTVMMSSLTEHEDTTKVAADAEANYNVALIKASAKAQLADEFTIQTAEHTFQSKTTGRGGDPTVWLGYTGKNKDDISKAWAKTFNTSSQADVGFAIHPIWDLLNYTDMNKTKAEELKKYMVMTWAKNKPEELPWANESWSLIGLGGCESQNKCGEGWNCGVMNIWTPRPKPHSGGAQTLDECKKKCQEYTDKGGCWYIVYYHVADWDVMSVCKGFKKEAQCEEQKLGPYFPWAVDGDSTGTIIEGSVSTWQLDRIAFSGSDASDATG